MDVSIIRQDRGVSRTNRRDLPKECGLPPMTTKVSSAPPKVIPQYSENFNNTSNIGRSILSATDELTMKNSVKLPLSQLLCRIFVAGSFGLLITSSAFAVTVHKKKKTPFLYDITTFTTTLTLPVKDMTETVRIPGKKIEARLSRSTTDERVEPLSIILGSKDSQLVAVAEKIAAVGQEDALADYLRKQMETAKYTKKGSGLKVVYIRADGFPLIDIHSFSDLYSRTNRKIKINSKNLRKDKVLTKELLAQIKNFIPKKMRKKIKRKIRRGKSIDVAKEMLPEFARKMVGKYIVFRGPNCFHAALAFHSPKMTSSSLINVKKEKGYHRAMINYDELWRAINHNFYEVNPDEQALKYGDMLVFFDVPEDEDATWPVNYKWIRHTTTYLFGGYTFSKGSKSPNTPYTLRTLADEWRTWKKFVSNLGVRVYRRSKPKVTRVPPREQIDWLY